MQAQLEYNISAWYFNDGKETYTYTKLFKICFSLKDDWKNELLAKTFTLTADERFLSVRYRCDHMSLFVFPVKNNEDRHVIAVISRGLKSLACIGL